MIEAKGYAARGPKSGLAPYRFKRRRPGKSDVVIEILYCGICHSDIHQVRNEWEASQYPMVPGHEIAGRVLYTGSSVSRFKKGDLAGIGCFVDSCRRCASCRAGLEQFCENHISWTYNGTEQDKKTRTHGGYSSHIVADEKYVYRLASGFPLEKIAPLLCAGITTYSPLRYFGAGPGKKVAVVGFGGLGHMGVKIAASMGAEVTVLSRSRDKAKDARRFGAAHFVDTRSKNLQDLENSFDLILNTVSASHDLDELLSLLRRDGTLAIVGAPEKPLQVSPFSLIMKRRRFAGSLIGGLSETQEMLDYCAKHKITADVEVIPVQKINQAYARMLKGDVRYRFVIDLKSLEAEKKS